MHQHRSRPGQRSARDRRARPRQAGRAHDAGPGPRVGPGRGWCVVGARPSSPPRLPPGPPRQKRGGGSEVISPLGGARHKAIEREPASAEGQDPARYRTTEREPAQGRNVRHLHLLPTENGTLLHLLAISVVARLGLLLLLLRALSPGDRDSHPDRWPTALGKVEELARDRSQLALSSRIAAGLAHSLPPTSPI